MYCEDIDEGVVLGDGKMIEEVFDSKDGDEGYCIMEYNSKFYFCSFDFGGSLCVFERFDSLKELRSKIDFS